MSFSDFKEVSINNPGTSTFYGADDLNEIMRIFNAKIVTNRRIRIKNPWQWLDNFDIVAASVIPGNPGANTKRFYVDPVDNHFKMKSPGGTTVDFDVIGAGAVGEANTASNVGVGGVGPFKQKTSANLEFRNINAGSNKITVALDATNNEIDIDAVESNLLLQNMSGILNVSRGGTGVNTHTTNGILKGNASGNIASIAPGTDGQILTMQTGAPVWAASSASSDIRAAVFEGGIQIGAQGRRLNFTNLDDFAITEDAANDRFDIATVRSEVCVASWINPTIDLRTAAPTTVGAFTDVGTTYRDLFTSGGDGVGADVDGTGMNNFRFYVSWHKNGGTGTHGCRLIDQGTAAVLAEVTNCVNGRNAILGTIPASFQDTVRPVKLQIKSTTSTDDPIFKAAHLYYK